jgi:hypothetical protein
MLDPQMFELSSLTEKDILAFLERYRNDPVLFSSEVLGVELDDNQKLIANAVRDYPRVAVVSGRGIGKTILDGCLSLWFWSTHPQAEVRMLANTDRQSRDVLWPPMVRIFKKSCIQSWGKDPSTEALFFEGNKMGAAIRRVIWSANSIESVSGVHAEHLLFILDEASKMPNDLIESINSGLTQAGNKIVLTSNGTRNSGYFYNACEDPVNWHVLHIDSRSSKWTDKKKIKELVDKYGEESDIVRVNVRGLFPMFSSASIVSDGLVLAAMRRLPTPMESDAIICGFDIGSGGDPSVWVIRKGRMLLAIETDVSCGDDEDKLIAKTMQICRKWSVDRVILDATGIGRFIPQRLRKSLPRVDIVGINFAAKAPIEGYMNMRCWMYFRLKDWFDLQPSIAGVEGCEELREDILATEYYTDQSTGKLAIMRKEQIRSLLGRSPDKADGLALSCAYMGDLCGLGRVSGTLPEINMQKLIKGGTWAEPPVWSAAQDPFASPASNPMDPRWR